MMKLTTAFVAMTAAPTMAQHITDQELARLLASDATRAQAVAQIATSGSAKVPLLLSWTEKPPIGVEKVKLYLGLAEVFGRLRTTKAVPFLIKNITLQDWPESPNTWMKTPEVIEARMPAVAALIRIGPEASIALIRAPITGLTPEERLAAIFVVSRSMQVPEAREFLVSILGQANMERFSARSRG